MEFADRAKLYALVSEAQQVTGQLIESFKYGNVIRNGVQVAIVGKPNAGKSTLLNRLLNEQRAIVSEIAGTTRDTIEESLMISGIEFRLIDTAGIRQHTADQVEQLGMNKTREKIEQADIVLEILDATDPVFENIDIAPEKLLQVVNKTDLVSDELLKKQFTKTGLMQTTANFLYDSELRKESSLHTKFPHPETVFISAKTAEGIVELKNTLVRRVLDGLKIREGTVVTNARHHEALKNVSAALQEIRDGLDNQLPGDLLSLDIRRCLHYLGEITGEITNEEQLSWIFGKFCIGK